MDSTDGRLEPPLVSSEAAARRALVLRSLLERHWCEEGIEAAAGADADPDEPSAESYASIAWDVVETLGRHDLWPAASAEETRLLHMPLSEWSEQDQINVSWRSEALVALLWTLGVIDEMPSYAEQSDLLALLAPGSFLEANPAEFIEQTRLRDEKEVRRQREIAEGWLWRARAYQIAHADEDIVLPPGVSLAAVVEEAARELEAQGEFEALEGDYPVKGKPYARLTEKEWAELHSLAIERLHALNWVCGHSDDWDNVPLDA